MDRAPTQVHPAPDPGALAPVIAIWQGLRRGRAVPARTDLDPVALQPWLSASGILERDGAGRVRFRLGGRLISDCLGVEPRGMPLRALFAPSSRDRLHDLAAAMLDGPQLLKMTLETETDSAAPVSVPCVVMPLSDGSGNVNRALLCLDFDPRAARMRPCRMRIRQAHLATLVAPRLTAVKVSRQGAPALRVIAGGRG